MTINHREPGYVFPMLLLLEDEKIIFSIHNLFYKAILSKGGCFHASMSLQNTEPHLSRPCLAHLEFISQLRTLLFKETILKMFAGENTRHSRGFRGCIYLCLFEIPVGMCGGPCEPLSTHKRQPQYCSKHNPLAVLFRQVKVLKCWRNI